MSTANFIADKRPAAQAALDAAGLLDPTGGLAAILARTPRASLGEGLPLANLNARMDTNALGLQVVQLVGRQVVVQAAFAQGSAPQFTIATVEQSTSQTNGSTVYGFRFSPAAGAIPGTVPYAGVPAIVVVNDPAVDVISVVSSTCWLMETLKSQQAGATNGMASMAGLPAALAQALAPLFSQTAAAMSTTSSALAQLKPPETVAMDLGWRKASFQRAERRLTARRHTEEEIRKLELEIATGGEEENADTGVIIHATLALRAGNVAAATALLEERTWEKVAPLTDTNLRAIVREQARARACDYRVPGSFGVLAQGAFTTGAPQPYKDAARAPKLFSPNAPVPRNDKERNEYVNGEACGKLCVETCAVMKLPQKQKHEAERAGHQASDTACRETALSLREAKSNEEEQEKKKKAPDTTWREAALSHMGVNITTDKEQGKEKNVGTNKSTGKEHEKPAEKELEKKKNAQDIHSMDNVKTKKTSNNNECWLDAIVSALKATDAKVRGDTPSTETVGKFFEGRRGKKSDAILCLRALRKKAKDTKICGFRPRDGGTGVGILRFEGGHWEFISGDPPARGVEWTVYKNNFHSHNQKLNGGAPSQTAIADQPTRTTRVTGKSVVMNIPAPAPIPVAERSEDDKQRTTKKQNGPPEDKPKGPPPSYQSFRCAHSSVPQGVAALLAGKVKEAVRTLRRMEDLPALTKDAVADSTREAHYKWLKRFADLDEETARLPVVEVIAKMLTDAGEKWCPTTRAKEVGTAAGAMKRLSLYTGAPFDVDLSTSSVWRDIGRAAAKKAQTFERKKPRPITEAEARTAVENSKRAGNVKEAVFMALMWCTTGRPGCIAQLRRKDIVFVEGKPENRIRVTITAGKAQQLLKGAQVIFTIMPTTWTNMLKEYLKERKPEEHVFPFDTKRERLHFPAIISQKLKEIGTDLWARSFRSGALLHMLRSGASEELLLHFSGHSSIQTLRQYVGVSEDSSDLAGRMRTAAVSLLPSTT